MNLLKILSPPFLFFLKRRYQITIEGEELLKCKGAKLIIPNHPAQVDAQILIPITVKH